MLATYPSPTIHTDSRYEPAESRSPKYDIRATRHQAPTSLTFERRPNPVSPIQQFRQSPSARSLDSYIPPAKIRRRMVDAGTQYSPPKPGSPDLSSKTPVNNLAGLEIADRHSANDDVKSGREAAKADATSDPIRPAPNVPASPSQKRQAEDGQRAPADELKASKETLDNSPSKKSRPHALPATIVPQEYEFCEPRDLVVLISSMLMELIRYNDAIPLKDGHLTRFHSRAPPGISVQDYLQRLTTHATLVPPILLSMVYYIDRLCALYPAFTITSLTVHRFLIASATVASKGLSDSFWTNKTYARVGGVSVKELALLELEFLTRLEWRIVPNPEVLTDYYRSLVKRSETHAFGPRE